MTEQCPHCHARLPQRVDFLPPSYGTEALTGVLMITAGFGALLFGFFHKWWPPDWWLFDLRTVDTVRLVAVSSLYGMGIALEGVAVSVIFWKLEGQPPRMVDTPDYDEFAATARNTLRRLPRGVRQQRLWQFLIGIARDRETITLSQRGASAYGFSQTQANQIKDWCCEVGWYEVINGANGYGQWTAEGERVLAMLAQHPPALWSQIINPPTAGDAYRPERAVLDQRARGSTGSEAGQGEYELEPWTD